MSGNKLGKRPDQYRHYRAQQRQQGVERFVPLCSPFADYSTTPELAKVNCPICIEKANRFYAGQTGKAALEGAKE